MHLSSSFFSIFLFFFIFSDRPVVTKGRLIETFCCPQFSSIFSTFFISFHKTSFDKVVHHVHIHLVHSFIAGYPYQFIKDTIKPKEVELGAKKNMKEKKGSSLSQALLIPRSEQLPCHYALLILTCFTLILAYIYLDLLMYLINSE